MTYIAITLYVLGIFLALRLPDIGRPGVLAALTWPLWAGAVMLWVAGEYVYIAVRGRLEGDEMTDTLRDRPICGKHNLSEQSSGGPPHIRCNDCNAVGPTVPGTQFGAQGRKSASQHWNDWAVGRRVWAPREWGDGLQ